MLNNKADLIEKYILNMLAGNGGEQVELKRTELADEVSCAPSQVSYVLSTRFTNSRGFQVESQRGLGGYIRITVLKDTEQDKKEMYQNIINYIEEKGEIDFELAKAFLEALQRSGYITMREAEIMAQNFVALDKLLEGDYISEDVRLTLIHHTFKTLSQIT